MKIIQGSDITELWLNLLIYTACDESTDYGHPYLLVRELIPTTENFNFENDLIKADFLKYSNYNTPMKMAQLRKEYYTGKVEKQFNVIKKYFHQFLPRQARASIYFSEPAFDKTSKLKCLESLYFQKENKTEYKAVLIFRNTEIYPKLFMDFYYLKELLDELDRESGVKCTGFRGFIVNGFINLHQVKLIEMFLKDWGISKFSSKFLTLSKEFDRKYNKSNIDKIKLISIKRVLDRTFRLMEV